MTRDITKRQLDNWLADNGFRLTLGHLGWMYEDNIEGGSGGGGILAANPTRREIKAELLKAREWQITRKAEVAAKKASE